MNERKFNRGAIERERERNRASEKREREVSGRYHIDLAAQAVLQHVLVVVVVAVPHISVRCDASDARGVSRAECVQSAPRCAATTC